MEQLPVKDTLKLREIKGLVKVLDKDGSAALTEKPSSGPAS